MKIPNRSISIIALLVGLAASLLDESAYAEASSGLPEPPNIILIVADDLGYGDLGSYGQTKVRTPVLDQLAAEGIRFTDFYAGSTVCAPSRASLLTGFHSGHSPVRENPRWTRSGHPVDFAAEDRLFSEILQDAGYSTAIIGKWGMAEDKRNTDLAANPAMPLQQGFDYFFGYRHHGDAHHYYWDTLYENNDVYRLEGNDYETNSGQYTHDLFTEKALEYIEGQTDEKPFLLYLAYTIPHMAITVPEDSKEPYRDLGWAERSLNSQGHYKHDPEGNTAFAGMVSRMDRDIGRIRALLEEKGIDENTLILFTSDNGHEYDDGFFNSNGPLRGMKRDLYEGGVRVPTIAWWPGTVTANTVSSHVGAFWDVLPTACELAQAEECPASDGLSFVPTLLGKKEEQEQHEYLYWEFNESQGPIQAVRSNNWKLVRFLGELPELYDLRSDIGEEHDVALQNPDVVQRLTTQMESARIEHPEFPLEWHPRKRPVADRPNIVLILVDDLGYTDIGAYNPGTFYETPNIDRLARDGAMFLEGYAVNPVCSPSRFAVMTGRHPSRFAATDWFHSANWRPRSDTRYAPAPVDQFLPLEETTLAEMLKASGYRTAFLGKWHLGEDEKYWPENQGFDINIGGHSKGSPPGGYFSPYDNPRMSSGPTGEYLPERLTSEAIDVMRSYADGDEPYFLMLSYYTVHTPLQAPEQTVEKYRAKQQRLGSVGEEFETEEQVWLGTIPERKTRVRQSHPVYASMIEHLDHNVGRILGAMKELGAEDDTIVIFTSDNGGLSTAGGWPTSNRPLRGGKGWLYEGGIKVPFIIAGPRPGTAGARIDAPVSGMDLLPTIVELAGIEPKSEQDIDGRSLVPLLSGESVTEDRPMFWHYPHYGNHGGFPGAAIRRGQYKLIERFEDGRIHLYDLASDVGEQNDLVQVHPAIAAEMQQELHEWYAEVGARFLQPKPRSAESPWRPNQKRAGNEYHVAKTGVDENEGSLAAPLLTIQAAAELAQPGDIVTVHEGTYRERINPPRGGTADDRRIVYRAAQGENVAIKGSERVEQWEKVSGDTWRAIIPADFFGEFNPYDDLIWGDWFRSNGRDHHTGAVYLNGHWLTEAVTKEEVLGPTGEHPLWFASVDEKRTTLWAQFNGADPNTETVEINVRQSVFYPEKPGVNYISVQGFTLEHAATPWAPPTAEQIGLIGTHWSKGWVIEDNTIRYSACSCVTLGKYGDEFDNTSDSSARGYVETIERGLEDGWSEENIGHHLVHNNSVSHCEQAGIVGSMGAAFSTISGNEIHDIHMRRLYSGMEMGGIKIHGAIDTHIINNHVYRTWRGIWLDWMAQGARVSGNLLHDNETTQDLFVEVNHGPFLIDNNFFLSGNGLYDISNGGAYAHNLFAGRLITIPLERNTPYHKAHSTEIAGMESFYSGDSRFYNNIFTSQKERVVWPERVPEELDNQHYFGLVPYDDAGLPVVMAGNVFLGQAEPSTHEKDPVTDPGTEPGYELMEKEDGWYLQLAFDQTWLDHKRPLVTSGLLGEAKIPGLPFEQPDGTRYQLDTDYLGQERHHEHPVPGPLTAPEDEKQWLKVWQRRPLPDREP